MAIHTMHDPGMSRILQAAYSSAPLSFPVSRSQYIYARFHNINSVPAPADTKGIPLSRLRIIDTLIGKLKNRVSAKSSSEFTHLDDNGLSAAIRELSARVHREAVKSPVYNRVGGDVSGLVVNLLT
ncbi:MAG: hypothetical protein JW874_00505 [Spirochaetales bacterium]|nr:hypothetical protein [Spirochaetales bacterium]